jgi:hypothetical protein
VSGHRWPIRILCGIALSLILGASGCQLLAPSSLAFPIDLKQVIPTNWTPVRIEEGDWDTDGDNEWLLLYRYDAPHGRGPIGGVIYDAQVDLQAQHGGLRLPTRPAFLIPYPLLPSSASGAGYLGEKTVEVRGYSISQDHIVDELAVLGWAYDDQLAFLSLFRWQGTVTGYQLIAHFTGDGGIEVEGGRKPERDRTPYQGLIGTVTVRVRVHDRSLLCRQERHQRGPGDVTFEPEGPATLDFTYGVPEYPAYPEGAVLAYYLALAAGNPDRAKTYLLSEDEALPFKDHGYWSDFPQEIHSPGPHPRIVEIAYKGETDLTPRLTGTVKTGSLAFESVHVNVAGIDAHGSWTKTWLVVNVAAGQPKESARWKLVGVYQ